MAGTLDGIQIPQQKLHPAGIQFPLVVSPTPNPGACFSSLPKTIQDNQQYLESELRKSGAILFRGFPVNTASDFNDVVEAFGFKELTYIGGAPRTNVVGRVFTSNESPPDQKIVAHHEMVLYPEYPSKLFFFCEVEPVSGGETPIALSHVVYERMKDKYPQFVQKLEDHGLIYIRVLGGDYDPSSLNGRGWKSTYSTSDKTIAEQRAAKLGFKLEWLDDGGVKATKGPIPGIKCDPTTQRKTWFNGIVPAWNWNDARNDPLKAVTFGDGSPLPPDIIYDCLRIHEEESVAIPWRKGDVLLLDNLAVLHSRNPCTTPRRVLASLCK